MEPFVKYLALLALCLSLGPAHQVPLWNEALAAEGARCARSCASDPRFLRYSSGKSYVYRLQTQTTLAEGAQSPTPISLDGAVVITAFGDCDLALQLQQVQISGLEPSDALQMQQELEATPLHFGYSDGLVTDVCVSARAQPQWALNIKKAIVSALQMASPSLTAESRVTEVDFQGACPTIYEPISERFGKHVIKKIKNLNNCQDRQQWSVALFPRQYSSLLSIPVTSGQQECLQSIQSDLIFGVTCQESQALIGQNQIGAPKIQSQLNLRYERQVDQLVIEKRVELRRHQHHLKMANADEEYNNQNDALEPIVGQLCQQMEQKSQKSSKIFDKLVRAVQSSSEEEQRRMMDKIQKKQICQQQSQSIEDLFVDALSQSGSSSAIKLLKKWIQANPQSGIRSQIIFRSLAFAQKPEAAALPEMIEMLTQQADKQHVVLGVSAYIHNLKASQPSAQEVGQQVEKAVEALLQKAKSSSEPEAVVAIKALQNIGLERQQRARQQLAQLAQSQQAPEGARVAALKTLSEALTGSDERESVMKVLANRQASNELRLNAFKALIFSGSDKQEMERIKKAVEADDDPNLKQYARSLIQNLKETSDPHKRDILRRLGDLGGQWPQPSNQWVGVANNFETSFLIEALGVGAVLQTDVIYERQSRAVPSSITVNVTLPVLGREVNLLEVEVRQRGLDKVLESKFREIQEQFSKEKNLQKMSQLLSTWQQEIRARNAYLELSMKMDAKTVFYFNSQQNSNSNDFKQQIKQIYRKLFQQTLEGAFAFQPISTRVRLPSANGWPVVARVNSTLVANIKSRAPATGRHVSIAPFFVWQTEAGLQLQASNQKREVGVAFNVQSAPLWESMFDSDDQKTSMKISFAEDRISLFKSEAEVRASQSGSRGLYGQSQYQKCSQWTRKAFGFEMCFEKNAQKFEIFVQKSDKALTSYEVHVTRAQNQLHVQLNTPGSQVDRNWEADLEYANGQQLKMAVRSPWTRLSLSGQMRSDDKEQSLQMEIQRNGKKELALDVALEQQSRGQKREFRPRVSAYWSGQEVLNVGGSVSVAKGRKNQLMINLEGNQKQFLKGSLVREGDRKSADIRVSSDLNLQLSNGLEVKIVTLVDKSPKHIQSDLQLEYRVSAHARKESLKTSVKVQSLSQSNSQSAQKLSMFGEVTSTQWPRFNCHVAYNLLNKQDHVENELTVQWNKQLQDKIHVLQVTKVTAGQHINSTVNIVVTPLQWDYELRANGQHVTQQDTRAELVGKDRSGTHAQYDFKSNVAYKHVSRAPLHLTLAAQVKTNAREYQYNDELRETGSGQYKGQTSVQWSNGQGEKLKMAKMDYEYQKKADMDHQVALQIQSPFNSKPIKHYSLLRMSKHDAHVKSRLLFGDAVNHHVEALLSDQGPNRFEWEGLGYQVRGHAHPYVLPQKAGLEFVHTPTQVTHKTSVEIVPKTSFRLRSDTKRRNDNIFALDSQISRNSPSKIYFNTKAIEGKADFRSAEDEQIGQLELNHVTADWKHSTSVRNSPRTRLLEIQSKTVQSGKPTMTFETRFDKSNQKINFRLPERRTSVLLDAATSGQRYASGLGSIRAAKVEVVSGPNFRHSSSYSSPEESVHRFESSQVSASGQPLYQVEYKKDQLDQQLNGHYLQNYLIDGQLNDNARQLVVNLKNKRAALDHLTNLDCSGNNYKFQSRLTRNGDSLAEIDGHVIANLNQESQLKIKLPRAQTRAHLIVTPSGGAKVQYASPTVDHVSALEWSHPRYSCDSKTTLANIGDGQSTYQLAGSHSPSRKSFISIKTPGYDVSGQVDKTWDTPSAKVAVITPKVSHVTEVTADRQRKSFRIESRADRKSGSQVTGNLYSFDGSYNHLNSELPSSFGLKTGSYKINGKIQPFQSTGNRYVQLSVEHPDMSHVTDLQLTPESHVIVKSRTSDVSSGNNLAKIDAYVPISGFRSKRSHVTFVSPSADLNCELEPNKMARVEFRSPTWSHQTIGQYGSGQYSLEHVTKKNQNKFFSLNSQISPSQQSLQIHTPSIGHETHVTRQEHVFTVDSQTKNSRDQLLSKINFDSQKQIHIELPAYSARGQWSPEAANIDFRQKMAAGRHVLAAVRMSKDRKQFGVDVAWDQQRDPNQRVQLDVSEEDVDARSVHVIKAQYAGNEVKLISDVQKRRALYGPNTWSLLYTPKYNPERDSLQVKVSHVIDAKQQEMECRFEYLEAQKPKLEAKLTTKLEPEALTATFQSTSAANADLNWKVDFKSRVQDLKGRNAQLMTEVRVQRQNNKEYALQWHVARDQQTSQEDVIKGQMTVETPSSGRQEMDFEIDIQKNCFEFNAKSAQKKLLEVKARADATRGDEKHVQVDVKSNIQDIPSVSVSGDYFRQKEVSLKIDFDGQRKAEVSLTKTGNDLSSGQQINFRFDTSVLPKVEAKTSMKKNSREFEFEIVAKVDAKEVFSAIISGQKQTSGVWTGSARVSENGAQLAQMEAESTSGPLDQFSYQFSAKSLQKKRFLPQIRVLFSIQTGNRETGNRIKVNFCEESQQNTCLDVNGLYKKSRDNQLPERLELNVQKSGNSFELKSSFGEHVDDRSSGPSALGLTSGRVQQKYRNQMFVAINGHQMGFESLYTARGRHRFDNVLRVEFPNRKQVTFKTDFAQTSGQWTLKTQVMDSGKQEVLLETEAEAQDNGKEVSVKAEVKSNKFRKSASKKIEFYLQKPSQELKIDFRSKLSIFYSDKEQPITVETSLDRKQIDQRLRQQRSSTSGYLFYGSSASASKLNNTFNFRISDNQKLNFQLSAHASPQTAGIELTNQNRRQKKQFARFFIQSEPSSGQERRFQAWASTNERRYKIEGAWLNDEVSYQLQDERSGQKADVRVALQGKCLQWESRDFGNQKAKYDLCLNLDDQSQESIQLTLEETSSDGRQKQLSANLELDSRGQPAVRVDVTWTPQLIDQWYQELKNGQYGQYGQYSTKAAAEYLRELGEEVTEKTQYLFQTLGDEIIVPIGQLLGDQIQDLLQEFQKIFGNFDQVQRMLSDASSAICRQLEQIKSHVSRYGVSVDSYWRPLARSARKSCQKYELCYKFLYGIEKYGFDSIVDYFQWNIQNVIKESHRLVVLTSGKIYYSLPVPQWLRDYRQSFAEAAQSIIDSNPTLQSMFDAINRLFTQIGKDWDQIDGQEVKKSAQKLANILLDVSAQRVVVFDPEKGRFSLEIRSTALRRSIRSAASGSGQSELLA